MPDAGYKTPARWWCHGLSAELQKLRYLTGILRIGKLALHREGVGGEPLQQLFAKGADHLGLRIVNVGINEPRQQQLTPQIDIALQGMQKGFPLLPWQQGDNFPSCRNNRPSSR